MLSQACGRPGRPFGAAGSSARSSRWVHDMNVATLEVNQAMLHLSYHSEVLLGGDTRQAARHPASLHVPFMLGCCAGGYYIDYSSPWCRLGRGCSMSGQLMQGRWAASYPKSSQSSGHRAWTLGPSHASKSGTHTGVMHGPVLTPHQRMAQI